MADYTMFRGDHFKLNVQIKDQNGAPKNISGGTVYFTAKRSPTEPDSRAVSQLSTGALGGMTIVDAVSGRVAVKMPPQATLTFPDGTVTLDYDVQLIESNGDVSTVEIGTIDVVPDITRAIS